MKIVKTSLIVAAFLLILVSGAILNVNSSSEYQLLGLEFNRTKAAVFFITFAVILYFFGRLIGVVTKFKQKND